MPNKGDSFTIELKPAHMKWGIYRYTYTRDHIRGKGIFRYLGLMQDNIISITVIKVKQKQNMKAVLLMEYFMEFY